MSKYTSCWKDIFSIHRLLGWQFFLPLALKFFILLFLMRSQPSFYYCFPPASFKIFWRRCIMVSLAVASFSFYPAWGLLKFLYMLGDVFHNSQDIWDIIFSNTFCSIPSAFFWDSKDICQTIDNWGRIFFQKFFQNFLCSSEWIISIYLSSNSLSHFPPICW